MLVDAFDHDGSWLDVGCANGLLMETLTMRAREKGLQVKPYGFALSPRIAEVVRRRLQHSSDRISTGNVMTWEPQMPFDYITVIADSVPATARHDLVERLITRFL